MMSNEIDEKTEKYRKIMIKIAEGFKKHEAELLSHKYADDWNIRGSGEHMKNVKNSK